MNLIQHIEYLETAELVTSILTCIATMYMAYYVFKSNKVHKQSKGE